MELEAKLKEEALALANKLSDTKPGTEECTKLLNHYQTVMRMLEDETRRINSNQEIELQAKKLDVERDKIELEAQRMSQEADFEEEKLKMQRNSNWWQLAIKVAGVVAAGAVTLGQVFWMVKFNNSGECIPSWMQKAIQYPKLY